MRQKISLPKAMLLGVGTMLLSEVLCLFIAVSCAAVAVGFPAMNCLSILCTAGIHIGVLADYANKMAKRDQDASGMKRPLLLGLACAVPVLALWGLLVLCKECGWGNFLPAYRFLNAPFFQLLTMLCGETKLSELAPGLLWGFLAMTLVPLVTVPAVYCLTRRGEKE